MKKDIDFDKLEEFLQNVWNDRLKERDVEVDFTVDIYEGWSSEDEEEPYWMFSAQLGSMMLTGRGGLKMYISKGYPIDRIIYNGIEVRKDRQQEFIDEVIFGDEEE